MFFNYFCFDPYLVLVDQDPQHWCQLFICSLHSLIDGTRWAAVYERLVPFSVLTVTVAVLAMIVCLPYCIETYQADHFDVCFMDEALQKAEEVCV
jgi:hypothetical protein